VKRSPRPNVEAAAVPVVHPRRIFVHAARHVRQDREGSRC
jgi:hypothetical protein